MEVQVTAGSLVRTIVGREISGMIGQIVSQLQTEVTPVVAGFLSAGISASRMLELENRLAASQSRRPIKQPDFALDESRPSLWYIRAEDRLCDRCR